MMSEFQNQKYTSKQIPILKQQLTQILKENTEKDGVVVSLQGSWGIGKTFFWNDFAEHSWNENAHVYISLFGKHKLDEIKKQIVLKVYDANKVANFIDKNPIIGKIIETKWGVDVSMVANAFTKETFEGVVLCFDDFERISPNLSITEVLGFISELKEQHKCKIVLINNNDSLKEHDEANHSKTIATDEDGNPKELHITTKTNNQGIFDKFSEKIIDYRLYYEPHPKDNLALVKDESLEFVSWELVEELLSYVNDANKKANIRLMKQFISKLKLFEELLSKETNERISHSIVQMIFKAIFEIKKFESESFAFANISSLKPHIDTAIKKHYVEKESFIYELQKLNDQLNKNNETLKVYDEVKEKYDRFLYELAYSDKSFAEEFYTLFEEHKKEIVKIVSAISFKWYIELMCRVDKENEKKYKDFYIEAMKYYIDTLDLNNTNIPSFVVEEDINLLSQNAQLKEYYENKRASQTQINLSDINTAIRLMQKPKEQSGWHPRDEELLSSITVAQHKEWMIESKEYLQTCFDFTRWVKGFAGNRPFETTYENILEAIKELAKDDEYKNKLELMIDFFEKEK
ncbi:P-loop NTPase fold protein [Sulfurimonas sp.]|uniref:P-loop NTPase fold protein n=1 Tax=Sulfurimonas sp. TaxID=2022749 RepID=UPI0019F353C0|nr:P-loop NTPase fold protein [Sulfurimonas sp.]MBE0515261.1 hypothetical protein [Sulfurimonas sp.]